jgi:hypothetical protein
MFSYSWDSSCRMYTQYEPEDSAATDLAGATVGRLASAARFPGELRSALRRRAPFTQNLPESNRPESNRRRQVPATADAKVVSAAVRLTTPPPSAPAAEVGSGRIIVLHHRASTSYRPDSRRDSAPLFLKRHCGRTPGGSAPKRRGDPGPVRQRRQRGAGLGAPCPCWSDARLRC